MSYDFDEGDSLPKPLRALVEALREGIHSPNGMTVSCFSCECAVRAADTHFPKPSPRLTQREILEQMRAWCARLSKELGE